MLKGHHNLNGDHGVELMSYIYDELDATARNNFETHLAACDECIIELAAFSDARLGVVEWRREDFDHLATPEIVLPVSDTVLVTNNAPQRTGVFVSLFGTLSSLPIFARAGLGLAASALVVGLVYIAVSTGDSANEMASNSSPNASIPAAAEKLAAPVENTITRNDEPAKFEKFRQLPDRKAVIGSEKPAATRRQFAETRSDNRSDLAAKNKVPRTRMTAVKAPRLNNFDDEDDRSLRLSDLFAEIGGRDKE